VRRRPSEAATDELAADAEALRLAREAELRSAALASRRARAAGGGGGGVAPSAPEDAIPVSAPATTAAPAPSTEAAMALGDARGKAEPGAGEAEPRAGEA
jgi:hypothetical protein